VLHRRQHQIVLNAEQMKIQRVLFSRAGTKELVFRQKDDKFLEVDLEKPLQKHRPIVLRIEYRAKVNENHYGMFKVTDPDDAGRGNLFFTQLEAEGARRLFPCHDVPSDKATTEIEVATLASYDVVANGKRAFDKAFTKDKEKWHRVQWKQTKPHSTYLVALAVAPLGKLISVKKGRELSVMVGPQRTKEAKYLHEALPKLMEIHETLLGVSYPWDKYAVVGVPTFVWGGMENTSVTFQNEGRTLLTDPKSASETYRVIGLSAHELAHQWFGDYVTLATWDDIWLNEAFATYVEGEVSTAFFKNERPELHSVTSIWESYFRQEDGPRSHAIVEKNKKSSEDAFDAISYEKGANVLKTLEVYLGRPKFLAGLKAYLKKYALANATYEDFFGTMAKSSGENLDEFKNSWILERGYPVLSQSGKWDAEKKSYVLQVAQRPNHSEDKTTYRFRLPVVLHRRTAPAYDKAAMLEMGAAGAKLVESHIGVPEAPEWVTLNPGGKVLAKLESADELGTLELQMTYDPDPITRLWAARQVADPLFVNRTLSDAAESALARWLKSESSPYVRAALLELFQKKYFKYLPEKLASTLMELQQETIGKEAANMAKFEASPLFLSDPAGWRIFQMEVLGTLGKVKGKEILPTLAAVLGRRDLSLDNLSKAAIAVAQSGEDEAGAVLQETLKVHSPRGHQYRLVIQGAFGAWENPKAAGEIRTLAKTCGHDLPSRWAWLVKDNAPLRDSSEWSAQLKDILLSEDRLGDELKARLFSTVEESSMETVFQMANDVRTQTKSDRLKDQATKLIKKNFPNRLL